MCRKGKATAFFWWTTPFAIVAGWVLFVMLSRPSLVWAIPLALITAATAAYVWGAYEAWLVRRESKGRRRV